MPPRPLADELEIPYDLPPDATRAVAEYGFVHLRGVLPETALDYYGDEITREVVRRNPDDRPLAERDTYGRAFLQVMNLWRESPVIRDLVFAPRLARIAGELLGVTSVRLYHDQALYKEPSGGVSPWHADQYYWPLATDRTLTAWIPLQETPLDMGPLAFSAGSHLLDLGRGLPISDESERELQDQLAEAGLPYIEEPFVAGDVSFHLGWTFHRARANTSDHARRVMTVIYVDGAAHIAPPANEQQEYDLQAWLAPAQPGDPVDGPLNPVLWSEQ